MPAVMPEAILRKPIFFTSDVWEPIRSKALFAKSETNRLYNLIRTMGITNIASFAGMNSREIISYNKCELCRKLFNCPETLAMLQAEVSNLESWRR